METILNQKNLKEILDFADFKKGAENRLDALLREIHQEKISILRIPITSKITFAYFRNQTEREMLRDMIDSGHFDEMRDDYLIFDLIGIELLITIGLNTTEGFYYQSIPLQFTPQLRFIDANHSPDFAFKSNNLRKDDDELSIYFNEEEGIIMENDGYALIYKAIEGMAPQISNINELMAEILERF